MKEDSPRRWFEKHLEWDRKSILDKSFDTWHDLIQPIIGGIYFQRRIIDNITNPNPKISELVDKLEPILKSSDVVRDTIKQDLEELMNNIRKMPGFDSIVNRSDEHDQIKRQFWDFEDKMKEKWSNFKELVRKQFEVIENLLGIAEDDYKFKWPSYGHSYFGLAIGQRDDAMEDDFRHPRFNSKFLKLCEKASMPSDVNTNRQPSETPPKKKLKVSVKKKSMKTKLKQDSPKITQKPMLHKRKKIDFNISDLEDDVEDEDDSDFDDKKY